jgi:two-component system, chemotaxis family, chemotaxis protein CheY
VKILVADDSKAMRMIVIRNLRQAGFGDATILEAEDGKQGLDLALAESPDLILSDWNMPEMLGIEFLKELRAAGSTITFGFVTSESTAPMREAAANAGASFLLAKPFNSTDFEQLITACVRP